MKLGKEWMGEGDREIKSKYNIGSARRRMKRKGNHEMKKKVRIKREECNIRSKFVQPKRRKN